MALSFKKTINSKPTSANVVDGHLVLSLLNAQEPKIWRMDLSKIGSASFEIKQETDGITTKLILKPKKGTAEIIAVFNTQEEAVEALTLAAKALHGNGASTTSSKSINPEQKQLPQTSSSSPKWLFVILGLFVVIGLYFYTNNLIPETNIGFEQKSTSRISTSSPQETIGIPVSADDFLNGL